MNPIWNLFFFWIFVIVEQICRFIIILSEIVMIVFELIEMVNKYSSVQQDKGLLYTQQGYDIDNVPVPSEQKGIDHDELIGYELSGVKPKLPPVENKPDAEWTDDKSNRPDDNATNGGNKSEDGKKKGNLVKKKKSTKKALNDKKKKKED